MGIIGRHDSPDGKRSGTTVIAAGTKLVGDLTLSDSLHVDGTVEGKVHSEGEVSIGEQGRLEGEIQARNVMICGQFEGTIDTDRLEIVATGRVSGTITSAQLVIESGARFDGSSKCRDGEQKAAAPATSAAPTRTSGNDNPVNELGKKAG